jgi:hypothetical protein
MNTGNRVRPWTEKELDIVRETYTEDNRRGWQVIALERLHDAGFRREAHQLKKKCQKIGLKADMQKTMSHVKTGSGAEKICAIYTDRDLEINKLLRLPWSQMSKVMPELPYLMKAASKS